MAKKQKTDDSVCRNRKASFKFEILETLECGIVLHGAEVKSLREGKVSLEEAFARVENGELWLLGFHVAQYAFDTTSRYEPLRRRKLLAHSREVAKLQTKVDQKGLTLVPLRVYFNDRGIAKVQLAVARGQERQRQAARDEGPRTEARYGPVPASASVGGKKIIAFHGVAGAGSLCRGRCQRRLVRFLASSHFDLFFFGGFFGRFFRGFRGAGDIFARGRARHPLGLLVFRGKTGVL